MPSRQNKWTNMVAQSKLYNMYKTFRDVPKQQSHVTDRASNTTMHMHAPQGDWATQMLNDANWLQPLVWIHLWPPVLSDALCAMCWRNSPVYWVCAEPMSDRHESDGEWRTRKPDEMCSVAVCNHFIYQFEYLVDIKQGDRNPAHDPRRNTQARLTLRPQTSGLNPKYLTISALMISWFMIYQITAARHSSGSV